MTKEEYWEYWNSMSHSELMVRAGLYIDRIAELEAQLQASQQWQQLTADEEHAQLDKKILIQNEGRWLGINRNGVALGVWLDELGCAVMRKVQPVAEVADLDDDDDAYWPNDEENSAEWADSEDE